MTGPRGWRGVTAGDQHDGVGLPEAEVPPGLVLRRAGAVGQEQHPVVVPLGPLQPVRADHAGGDHGPVRRQVGVQRRGDLGGAAAGVQADHGHDHRLGGWADLGARRPRSAAARRPGRAPPGSPPGRCRASRRTRPSAPRAPWSRAGPARRPSGVHRSAGRAPRGPRRAPARGPPGHRPRPRGGRCARRTPTRAGRPRAAATRPRRRRRTPGGRLEQQPGPVRQRGQQRHVGQVGHRPVDGQCLDSGRRRVRQAHEGAGTLGHLLRAGRRAAADRAAARPAPRRRRRRSTAPSRRGRPRRQSPGSGRRG